MGSQGLQGWGPVSRESGRHANLKLSVRGAPRDEVGGEILFLGDLEAIFRPKDVQGRGPGVGRGGRGVVQEETHGRVQSELRDGVRLARPGDGDDSDAGKEASRTDAPRIEVEGFGVVGGRGRQNADFDARDDGTDATRAHRTMTTMCNESLCGMLKFVCVLL